MAHWLLRGRMAEHTEDGRGIKDEQRRPEQNKGYDEAARAGAGALKTDVGPPPDQPRGRESGK
jgi:hypothetical protein